MNVLNRITISKRIILLMLIVAIGTVALLGMSYSYMRDALYNAHINETKHMVQSAHRMITHFDAHTVGVRNKQELQKIALHLISNLHHSEDSYFWITDATGTLLTHPTKDLVGTNLLTQLDAKGRPFFKDIIKKATTEGKGLETYYWPVNTEKIKMSYFVMHPEWSWIIGSGVYTKSIDEKLQHTFIKLSIAATSIFFLIFCLTIIVGQSISTPVKAINNTLKRIAFGDLNADVTIDTNRSDEIGDMARTVKTFIKHAQLVAQMDAEKAKIEKAKNELTSVVSHELRTPLTSIRGSLGLVLGTMKDDVPEKTAHLIQIAYDNCERLVLLINDLLDIDKAASGKMDVDMQVEPLHPLLQKAADCNKAYAEKFHTRIKYMPIDERIEIKTDRARLTQVLSNLLSNAAKFSPAGGTIRLEASTDDVRVRISVIDHGLGIPEGFKSNIFSKFAQADASATRKKSGTGLGLNIAKSLVELMGGKIGFDSKDGFGTTFWIDFPLPKQTNNNNNEG